MRFIQSQVLVLVVYFMTIFNAIAIFPVHGQASCPSLNAPVNAEIITCTKGDSPFSVCTINCVDGYEKVKGDARQICWCLGNNCMWQGTLPFCKEVRCPNPDYTFDTIHLVDSWKGGSATLVAMDRIPRDITSNWAIAVAFTHSIGQNATVSAWGFTFQPLSDSRDVYILRGNKVNSTLFELLHNPKHIRFLLNVNSANDGKQENMFVGLYNNLQDDVSCFSPKVETEIEQLPFPMITVIEEKKCPEVRPTLIPVIPTATKRTPFTKPQITIPTTTTAKPTTTTPAIVYMKKINNKNCKKQRTKKSYSITADWDDEGASYFSGNAVADVLKVLSNWLMLLVFNSPIEEIEIWNSKVNRYSDDGYMWTFEPNSWNTILDIGEHDVSFVARQKYKTVELPNATVYLCSEFFIRGDRIIAGPPKGSATPAPLNNRIIANTPAFSKLTITNKPKTSKPKKPVKVVTTKPSKTWSPLTTPAGNRCSSSSPMGVVVKNPSQAIPATKQNTDGTKYNYNKVLHLSILYYEAQRAGYLPTRYNRIPWRGHAALKDGCEIGADLSKGWFDAADHVKFNFPMAFSVTTLSWGGILFRDAYRDAMELKKFISSIKWPVEYLIACHVAKNEIVGQVGNPRLDHMYWGRPEEMKMKRPVYKISSTRPGSDLAGEMASALAASSIVLKKTHKQLSNLALSHAREIFDFAHNYKGKYDDSIREAKGFYASVSGYDDELLWSAAWMYKATGEQKYLDKAKQLYNEFGAQYFTGPIFSWDHKLAGAQVLLANLTGEPMFRNQAIKFMENMMSYERTPQGQMYYNAWAPNRYSANVAFIALVAATLEPPLPRRKEYYEFAKKQIHILLGDGGRSYVVGFGKNSPKNIHQRSSSCPAFPKSCNRNIALTNQDPNPFILYGALVGGPNKDGEFFDKRPDFKQTETACDYNAGFQSAVAGNVKLNEQWTWCFIYTVFMDLMRVSKKVKLMICYML